MSISTLALPIAFLTLATCLLWVLAKSRAPLWARSIIVIVTMFFGTTMWMSLGDLEGWPATSPPEKTFELHSALIFEPKSKKSDDGCIYLWLTTQDPSDRSASTLIKFRTIQEDEPRAYKIPYSKPMHRKIAQAQRAIKKGRRVMMTLKKIKGDKKRKNGHIKNYKAEVSYKIPGRNWNKPSER